jgi:hypothetical protein
MLKKILATLLIVPIIGFAIYSYVHLKEIKTPVSPAISAIPINAALVIECREGKTFWQKLTTNNLIWQQLTQSNYFSSLDEKIKFLDSLFKPGSVSYNLIKKETTYISAHIAGAGTFDFLFYINLPVTTKKEFLLDFIKNASPPSATINDRIYDGITINEVKLSGKRSFYYLFSRGIFICSFSKLLAEDAVRQLNGTSSLMNDPSFAKVMESTGNKVDGNVFVNYRVITEMISPYLENNANFLRTFKGLANWTSFDLGIRSNSFSLNGFTFSSDSANNYLNIFKEQQAQEITVPAILPRNTAYFIDFGCSNLKRYFRDYRAFLENSNQLAERENTLKTINGKYDINLEEFFSENVEKEFALAIIEPDKEDYADNYLAVFKLSDAEKTIRKLEELRLSTLAVNHAEEDTSTTNYRNNTIGKINLPAFLPALLGENFGNITENYYTIKDDYLLMANNVASLRNVLSFARSNKTLSKDSNYVSFSDNIQNESNICIYSNIGRSTPIYKKNLAAEYKKGIDKKLEVFRKFQAVAFQFSNKNDLFYTNAYLRYKPVYKKETRSVWETPVDTTVSAVPQVLAGKEDKDNFIFFQDDGKKIYLMNGKGELLWKKQLGEKMMGGAQIVYMDEEKEPYFVFSSASAIYALNNKGEDAEHFPLKLEAVATVPVAAHDYSGKGENRLFIACNDRKVYQFFLNGKRVKDWQAKKMDDIVLAPLSLFSSGGRDFVFILDRSGNMKLLDKKGQWILRLKDKLPDCNNNHYVLDKARDIYQTSITVANSKGEILRYYFRGKLEKQSISSDPFTSDFDPKTGISAICEKNSFYTVNAKGEKSEAFLFDKTGKPLPQCFHLRNGKTIIAVSNPVTGELHLFDQKGELMDDFPIPCNTPVDFGFDRETGKHFIIGSAEKRIFLFEPE